MAIPFANTFLNHPRTRNAANAADPIVLEAAAEIVGCALERLPDPHTFFNTVALKTAENLKQHFQSGLARQGGLARKADSLTLLIEEIVLNNRKLSLSDLPRELKQLAEIRGVDLEFDHDALSFMNHDGRLKYIKISGLKDRLSRARKKSQSR